MTESNPTTWPPELPLVAILRGLQPERAADVARVLFDAGFRALEVPLNRPGAIAAIATIVPLAPADAWIGAGTVLDTAQVDAVGDTGASLVVSPHFDAGVVRRARERGMRVVPGVFTASEAFAAWRAGADALKIFPAEAMTHAGLAGLTTVLPPGLPLWPVGGIAPDNLGPWRRAGATGFGLGGGLFKPELTILEIASRARAYVDAWNAGVPA
ncbi:2-dehydro-3-deoxy-6-phosphogalactonate aldolase [Scleromatobacter humisilvae]|uniref:2-dehydro-3-deoxy-6-phosphogalactonate aldolase n=1 Tax=Scleromatobacter humisilvae TaxID=2897159 RepID=A0A9X2C2F6_9BURK|nr:2-dehydro-3-deoxy-6-phosphogalactonate aldolase [Scleromatobacter humisilvae]MCK9685910.1 2-dehydro-3-deoxy-6-phosphogalactonate aldolase [Scleromatobacter humisilvae]